MAHINKVFLIGNLTNDPELKQTESGKSVTRFGLAINQKIKDSSSKQKEYVCFVDIVVWNKLAEACADYLKKGKLVFIEGRLHLSSWEQDNRKHSKLEVYARTVQFLSPPEKQTL